MKSWGVINSPKRFEPYAIRTKLALVDCGVANDECGVQKISVKTEKQLGCVLIELYNRDFEDLVSSGVEM